MAHILTGFVARRTGLAALGPVLRQYISKRDLEEDVSELQA